MMKIYERDFERLARECIARFGNCDEHNYCHFLNLRTDTKMPVFIGFDNGFGMLALKQKNGKVWYGAREVLAPKKERARLLIEFAGYVLNHGAERVEVELEEDSRKGVVERLGSKGLRACKVSGVLDWPLFEMKDWDEKLAGGKWKKLRNIRNKFYKEHKVSAVGFKDADKNELKRIVKEWKEKRKGKDFAYAREYLNVIDSGFKGFDCVRILVVDGKARAITGGWKVPNTNHYYSSLGVYDYSIDRLGEIANLDDLTYLKSRGYKLVNFGGSGKELLEFKNKFKPSSCYKTYIFSVKKK